MSIPLMIETVERGGSLVLVLHGELDISTSHLLAEALIRARDTEGASIVVDLRAVSFIDSTGLHVLIRHVCAEKSCPRIRLTNPSPQAQRLFELSGVLDCLPFVSD